MAIDNNPALRPPQAGELDENGQPYTAAPEGSIVNATSVQGTGGVVEPLGTTEKTTPTIPISSDPPPPSIDPVLPQTPVQQPTPVGGADFALPPLEPIPPTGSEMEAGLPPGYDLGGLEGYAADWMENPSRYDIGTVQQGIDLINAELERELGYGRADLDELMSSRGLVGSNVEADAVANLIGRTNQTRQQMMFDLAQDYARTHAQDRLAAGQYGMNVGQFSEQIASRLQQESQFARSLASGDARAAMDYGLAERAQQLQAMGMSADDAYRYASLQMEEDIRNRSLDLQERGLDEETAYRYAALDQDAQFRERALALQEEGMSLDEAYRQAELELRERELAKQRQMDILSLLLSGISGLDEETLDEVLRSLGQETDVETTNDLFDQLGLR